MNSTHFRTEQFALDGPIHATVAVGIAVILLGLFAWSLRRERHVTGVRNVVLFWTLRAVAVCTALWMLLAPSSVRFQRSTTRQSVAVVVDVSRSMQTVDPPDTADDYRWAVAAQEGVADGAAASADRALAAATLATQRLQSATAALRSQGSERVALEKALAAHQAVEAARGRVQRLDDLMAASSSTGPSASSTDGLSTPAEQVAEVLQALSSPNVRSLANLAAAIQRGQDAFPPGWRENMADLEHQLAGIQSRLAALAQRLADPHEAQLAEAESAALHQTRQLSRLQRTTRFLEAAERSVLQPLNRTADLRHLVFDDVCTPLSEQESIARQLAGLNADRSGAADGDELPVDADAGYTDLAGTLEKLRQMKHEEPLAAVVLLTDAGHNRPDGRDPRQSAAELAGTPVYVVPIGNTSRVRDVELKSVSAPSVVMKDDDVVIEAAFEVYDCEGESLRVELLRDGAVTDYRTLQVESSTAILRVPFHTQLTEVGLQRCQVRVVPVESELSEDNNFGQVEINVTRDRIRVLLADSVPRWEFRYLTQLFRRDGKVQSDELLFHPRMIATGERSETEALPITADQWAHYDVVLLGDLSAEQMPIAAQESLMEFVQQRGGTVVIIAGQQSMPHAFANQPLESMLPVIQGDDASDAAGREGYAFQVTEDGWRHHALMIADTEASTRTAWDFINRNSPFYWLSPYHRAKPATRTLIAAADRSAAEPSPATRALLSWQPIGRGRVVFLASPETFRLRFLRGDRLHYRFWGQLLRWAVASDLAAGSERVRIRTDRPDYRSGESVQVVVRLADETGAPHEGAAIEAVARGAGDAQVAIPLTGDPADPGRYVGTFQRLPAGVYQVEPRGAAVDALLQTPTADDRPAPAASFTVRSPLNRELLDTRSDRALAQQIADATGGQVLTPAGLGEILSLIPLEPIVKETTERLPLWDQWKYLWIVFGCLLSEWAVRKRLGLS